MIVDAYEGLDRKDFFELLDIPRTANDVQVKEAYFRLVKSFHPDTRSDPALADVEPMGEAVFLKLSEAYEKLRTRTSRQDYAASLPVRVVRSTETLPPPSQTPPGILGIGEEMEAQTETAHVSWLALQSLRMAESSFKAGQFGQCIRYAESALPNLEGYDAMRAKVIRARAMAKNPKWVKEAERAIQEVVKEHPSAHEAYARPGRHLPGEPDDQPGRAHVQEGARARPQEPSRARGSHRDRRARSGTGRPPQEALQEELTAGPG